MKDEFKKIINSNKVKSSSNITSAERDSPVKKKAFNFLDTDDPQEYYIKRLIYKIEKEKLPLLDIVSKIEDATKNKYRSIYGE